MKKLFTKKQTGKNTEKLEVTYWKKNKKHCITLWCDDVTANDDSLMDLLTIKLQKIASIEFERVTKNDRIIWDEFFGYTKDIQEILVCL